MRLRNTLSLGIASLGLGVLALAPASAQLQIVVSDNLGHLLTVVDGSAGDSNPSANAISIDAALAAAFPNLTAGSSVTASFNQPLLQQSRLTTTGDLFGNTASTITIVSSINNVLIPNANTRAFNSTNTIAFNNSAGTSGSDTDGVSTTNTLGVLSPADTTFNYASTGVAPNSGAGNGAGFVFAGPGAFAITSRTVIQVIPNGESQYTTNSIVRSADVPEPGSIAMLASFGVTGSGLMVRRFRKNKK